MEKIYKFSFFIFLGLLSMTWISCGDDEPGTDVESKDQFDRSAMIEHWVDGFIIPGYRSYLEALDSLESSTQKFVTVTNTSSLNDLRNSYRFAYNVWQEVSMFEIGKAEEISLRKQTNVYPTDTDRILENTINQNYNLALPSNIDVQGFPAIDFLIHAIADTDQAIVDQYLANEGLRNYLSDLSLRLKSLTNEVYTDWTSGYAEIFIADDGSSATSSVNRMVNDYLFYYERFLRGSKIAIPAGIFSGTPLANNVEALYTTSFPINKSLYLSAFSAFRDFFEGRSKYIGDGPSLAAYLDYIKDLNDGNDIAAALIDAMDNVSAVSASLDNDLEKQVIEDNSKMLSTFEAMQVITVLMKVDMLSALNISVDYVDADGD